MTSNRSVALDLGDDGRGRDGDVVALSEVHGLQMRVAAAQGAEHAGAVGDDPADADGLVDDAGRGLALERVQQPLVAVAIDLLGIEDAEPDVFGEASDVHGELPSPRPRGLPDAEVLRVGDASTREGRGRLWLQHDARDDHRSEHGPAARLVDSENHAVCSSIRPHARNAVRPGTTKPMTLATAGDEGTEQTP